MERQRERTAHFYSVPAPGSVNDKRAIFRRMLIFSTAVMIESAILMTKEELAAYFQRMNASYRDKKSMAVPLLEAKETHLLTEYDHLEVACRNEYRQRARELLQKKVAFDNKRCLVCQGKLRLVQSDYNTFYGCPNHRDGRQHTTFAIDFEAKFTEYFRAIKVRIPSDWLTQILKATSLHPQVAASDLLDFLLAKGYEDLREKHGWSDTKTRISGYVRAKKASSQEEQEIQAFLASFFPKLLAQQGIRYKLTGEKERMAILDILVSTNSQVFLLEIKRRVHDMREQQLSLYNSLLLHILQQKGDTRTLHSLFLVYDTPDYVPVSYATYLLFDDLRQAKALPEMLALFAQKSFYATL